MRAGREETGTNRPHLRTTAGNDVGCTQIKSPPPNPSGCVVVMVMGVDDRLLHGGPPGLSCGQAGHVVGPAIGGVGLLDAMPVGGKSGTESCLARVTRRLQVL